jgi:ParB family chromosome partitioning protein
MSKRKLILANNPLLSGPALRERNEQTETPPSPSLSMGPFREIPINFIDPDPNQPRSVFDEDQLDELTQSISRYGVLSPLLVRPSKVAGRFLVVAGERRLRAATQAGLAYVPAIIDRSLEGDKEKTLAIQLVENLQRADLSPLERAQAMGMLRDSFGLSIRDIAEKLGVSKSLVHRSLELLLLPPDLIVALQGGASESKILLLAKIDDEDLRATYLREIEEITRSDIEAHLKGSSQRTIRPQQERADSEKDDPMDPEDQRIADEIQRAVGVRVRLQREARNSNRGRLVLEFYSEDDLQEIFRKLVAEG